MGRARSPAAFARDGVSEDRGPLDFRLDEDGEEPEQRPPRRAPVRAGERLAEADAREEPPAAASGRAPRGRYAWFFGVVVVLVLAYASLNILRTEGTGARGVPAGDPLPPFAAPLALSPLDGDANVATRPDQGGRGNRPACAVRGAQILNVCQLAERGPVVLAFLAARGGKCERQLDLLERVRASPAARGVQVAAVAIRGDRDKLRRDIVSRGWRFPVGYDRDGLVASVYGVSVCPTITFAYPGGITMRTTLGLLGEAALRARVSALAAGSRARGWRPPPR
jgi:AhpC/TSA family